MGIYDEMHGVPYGGAQPFRQVDQSEKVATVEIHKYVNIAVASGGSAGHTSEQGHSPDRIIGAQTRQRGSQST